MDLELEQLDVKTAFLHGDLDEVIYMTQPEGFEVGDPDKKVCLLKKSLYGLKQAPRQWYRKFDEFMLKVGFRRSSYDWCVYFKKSAEGCYIYLLLYVDDMLIASKQKEEISKLKLQLNESFEMKDLGSAKKILGMEITRFRKQRKLFLCQSGYLKRVLLRFGFENVKPVSTPLANHFKLSADQAPVTEEEIEYMKGVPYSSVVGCLMYAMVCTRPDLANAVSLVSRFMAKPGKQHWFAVKWVMRYLAGTFEKGLMFGNSEAGGALVMGYVDSDFAGSLDTRKSQTGYVFTMFGTAVSWKACLQSVVALSTTEAEYMAITEAVKEALWMRGVVTELGLVQENVSIFCDSQGAIHLSKHQVFHERSKHIDVRLHFVRRVTESGEVKLVKISTLENPADAFTKTIPAEKFEKCLGLLGIVLKH